MATEKEKPRCGEEGSMTDMTEVQINANLLLAHAYVLPQRYVRAFRPEEALMRGTLFPELWCVYPIPR